MTLFGHPDDVQTVPEAPADPVAAKRPLGWSVGNWGVQWKVLAIALVPMVLAILFGGLRISAALDDAGRLRLAADRAEMIPAITGYMSALGGALVTASSGGDILGAKRHYDSRRYELQSRLARTDIATDVQSGVITLLERGQGLLDRVSSNNIGLRDQVTGYAPILLTAEDAITGSVRVDSERIRGQAEGLSRAVGARGQMMMQQMLLNRGGELPEPELRTSMITLAGTEPSTLFGMSQALGVDSAEAKKLQQQMVTRMALMSDPDTVLPNNPALRDSIRRTDEIATRLIADSTRSVTSSLEDQAAERRNAAIRDTVLMLAAITTALLVVWLMARSLVRPLRTLRDSALRVAHTDLEHEIARVRAGDEREPDPLPVYTTEEIGQVAHAVDELHAQALLLAGDEARLRLLVNEMFETMSRRNRSLVDQQLAIIDALERDEGDPDRLDSLFRLDHLAARMRRNGANLLVLAGAQISHDKGRSTPLSTVISAAISEVEDYRRVQTATVPDVTVTGTATGDTVHLLAELIDNALRYSPPTAQVRVVAQSTRDAGVVVAVVDFGLGMTDTDLRLANRRLVTSGEVTPENARHMGLFVVSRLAHRHGIVVRLSPVSPTVAGIAAEVYLPPELLVGAAGQPSSPRTPAAAAPGQLGAPHPDGGGTAHGNGSPAGEPAASLLPRRNPGSSGITGVPAEPSAPSTGSPRTGAAAYFAPRERVGHDPLPTEAPEPAVRPEDDVIYQRMLSEWLVDPHELSHSADLDWKSVWDHGWSVAAEAQAVPVTAHTEDGLPVREPGVRLVPGSATPDAPDAPDVPGADPGARHHAGPHSPLASNGGSHRPAHRAPDRNPDAIRASISSHLGGVRAGRSRARETGSEHSQGHDRQ